jgi:acetyl-CoA carboxylase biotin carboxyl carrier protein
MDVEEIKRILQLMEERKLVEFEYEADGRRLKLRRAEERTIPATVPLAIPAAGLLPLGPGTAARPDNVHEFKSPLVGTFYRSPKPDAEAFVNVGDEVAAEKVICIIEAMKVMNEIKAEMNGVIREIQVKNGQAVEYGETLFLIEKRG